MREIHTISEGRGLSYRKGVADALLDEERFKDKTPEGHDKAYRDGYAYGEQLKQEIAKKVKKPRSHS